MIADPAKPNRKTIPPQTRLQLLDVVDTMFKHASDHAHDLDRTAYMNIDRFFGFAIGGSK